MIKNIDHNNVIHYGIDSLIVVTRKDEFSKPFCLKIMNEEFPSPEKLAQFDNEYEFCSSPQSGSIRKALQKTSFESHKALALEFIEGTDLKKFLTTHSLTFIQQLNLAAEIAAALTELQKENIFHGQLYPSNIIIEKGTHKIYLIDFSTAAIQNGIGQEIATQKITNPAVLPYIAPEQTGRINRTIDSRADLYSLGIIFYQLFTGQLPFYSTDPVELMYSHIARIPTAPDKILPAIPQMVSEIVMKLLSKNAEDRYQSAFGLHHDLELCISAVQQNREIPLFDLASNDFSGKYYTQQKLYGRESELKILFKVFEECVEGEKRMLMVSGYSGCGKSALIAEVQKPIVGKNGIFISGKFDPLHIGKPYSAFVEAFTELTNHILTEPLEAQQNWKKRIQESIGNTGALLTALIPGVERLIGKQELVADLKGTEAQNRFNYTLLNFIKATSTKEQPLVIFIDDLQWADASSLNLFKVMMEEHDLKYVMVIAAYRDNEIEKGHALLKLFELLQKESIFFDEIKLEDLSYHDVHDMIGDLLHTRQHDAEELAGIIYQKTKGNAFYVHQFIKSIYEDKILYFDFDKRKWCWKKELIEQMNVSGNVVELMTSLIQKMPKENADLLKIASCIGNRFDKRTLSLIQQLSEKAVMQLLKPPLEDGLIIASGQYYKFAHDRIQQALYSLIPQEKQKEIHLQIGKALSSATVDADYDEKIFDIVNQWNIAAELITDIDTKFYLAKMNVVAAKKAIASTAYVQALRYYEKSIVLVDQNYWQTAYDFMLELTEEAAEAAYLCGDYAKVDMLVANIYQFSKNSIDLTKGYEISIKKLIAQNHLMEAIELGLDILGKMGISLSKKPGKAFTLLNLLYTKWIIRNKSADFFTSLPEMKDEEKNALMRILSDISSASYFAAPDLVPLLIFKMVRLTVKYGLSRKSPYSFAAYGFILSAYMGEIDNGIAYGQIALNLVKKLKADELNPSILTTNNVFLTHWKKPLRDTIGDMESAFNSSLESGDHEWGSYAAHNMAYQLFIMGFPLKELARKTELLDLQIEKFRQDLTIKRLRIFRESIHILISGAEIPDRLSGEIFNETEIGEADISENNKVYFHNLYFQKLYLALVFNLPDKAYAHAQKTGLYLESVRGSALYPLFYFYQSLSITGLWSSNKKTISGSDLMVLKKNIRLMKRYEKLSPDNYRYKRILLEAEYSQYKGDHIAAKLLYDEALKEATTQGVIHDLALCWERAAQFFENTKQEVLTRFYLQNAYKSYLQWGADAKLLQMMKQYPQLDTSSQSDLEPDLIGSQQKQITEDLDLATVIKASAALSGEIVLSRLLKKLMQITLESAGAQSGFMIMEKNGERFIEAEIHSETEEVITLQSIPLKQSGVLAESIVNYVYLTHEVVIIDNAVHSHLFANDEFIKTNRPKSILCLPILKQAKLQGIIYLSNDLISGAFTDRRLALLKLLTGQIAISIENALFYTDLENKVNQRTVELKDEKQKSDDLLLNILPEDVANELKQTGMTRPRSYERATVMFTDFKDFTVQSEKMLPEELVALIDTCFKKFDEIITRHNLEKIKTIGDAYLCVSGLPNPEDHNAADVIKAAREIIAFMKKKQKEAAVNNGYYFDIRIGIHTGPLVAGVVGNKKFAYDIWGDTVNTAARMEQCSDTNKINISQDTYELVKDSVNCTFRGKQHAKNKGMVDMYFVETD